MMGSFTRQLGVLDTGDMAPNEPITKACAAVLTEMKTAKVNWKAICSKDLPAFNLVLAKFNLKPISEVSGARAEKG